MALKELTLEEAGVLRSGKTKDIFSMSRAQMLRVAERLPQAMIKVTSFASGKTRVMNTVNYVNRNGTLPMETEDGHVLTSEDEVKDNVSEWSYDFGERKNSRDTMHMVLSTPKGSDRVATHRAVRDFAVSQFSRNHSYVFTMHNDTPYPHGHLIVKMRGHDGKKLNPRKEDLNNWRQLFAEKCREHGIDVEASPRLARGVGTKGGKRGTSLGALKASARGENAIFQSDLGEAIKDAWEELKVSGKVTLKAWEQKAKEITDTFRGMYLSEAQKIKEESKSVSGKDKELLEHQAELLRQFVDYLPEPKSLREEGVKYLDEKSGLKKGTQDIEPDL